MMQGNNAKLRPQDWRSGDRLWVVDIIVPFGGHDEMLKDLNYGDSLLIKITQLR